MLNVVNLQPVTEVQNSAEAEEGAEPTRKVWRFDKTTALWDVQADLSLLACAVCCQPCTLIESFRAVNNLLYMRNGKGLESVPKGKECSSVCFSYAITYCFPCCICFCMKKMLPWKFTEMAEALYANWGIEKKSFPDPFGDIKVCGALVTYMQPFTGFPGWLHLIRQMKKREDNDNIWNTFFLGEKYPEHLFELNVDYELQSYNFDKSTFDFFLSHTWQKDLENRDNHGRVRAFANVLKKHGYSVFFDEEEMHGNIYDRMANAIDNSTVFLAFLSRGYIDRVMSEDHNNCRYEFNIAIPKGEKAMAVVMEVGEKNMPLTHVPNWPGKISGLIGSELYIDYTVDEKLGDAVEQVHTEFNRWKDEKQKRSNK